MADISETLTNLVSDKQFAEVMGRAGVEEIAELPVSFVEANITRIPGLAISKFKSQLDAIDSKHLGKLKGEQAQVLTPEQRARRRKFLFNK